MKYINPDYPNPVYHVWHFCTECHKTWTHSQGSWDMLKLRECCRENLKSWSTDFYGVDLPDRPYADEEVA